MNELKWFLNIRITRNRKLCIITLYQNNYIDKLVFKFNINITKKTFEILLNYILIIKNNKQTTLQSIHFFQQRIKFINFAIVIICSNVICVTSKLIEFFINFSNYYINQSNHTLKYLINTKNYVIVFDKQSVNSNIIFINSFDVSFANNEKTYQNLYKYCFCLFNDMIDWKTSKQRTIITSFIEAKLLIMFITINFKI